MSQIDEFASTGHRIGSEDLVLLSFAANDVRYGNVGPDLAHKVVGYLVRDVQSLIDLGGLNFVLFGGIPFDKLGLTSLFKVSDEADRQYYTTLNAELPGAMKKLENSSVRILIMDMNAAFNRVLENPTTYGFLPGDCAKIPDCKSAPLATQNQYVFLQCASVGYVLTYLGKGDQRSAHRPIDCARCKLDKPSRLALRRMVRLRIGARRRVIIATSVARVLRENH